MSESIAIVWFRRDLRLADNPALTYALEHHDRVIPLYLHTPADAGKWSEGEASQWWLHFSLISLQRDLRKLNGDLIVRQDNSATDAFQQILNEANITGVYWNRLYTPWAIERDTKIKQMLSASTLEVKS